MKTQIKQYVTAAIIGLGLVLGVSSLQAAGGWTPAPTSPPTGNVDAPLNVGLSTQTKLGNLTLNADPNPYAVGLQVFGKSIFNGTVQIATGGPGAGKVLTSDASGNTSWTDLSTAAVGDSCRLIASTDGINSPAYQIMAVPPECINNNCTLIMPTYPNDGSSVNNLRSASLIQFNSTGIKTKTVMAYWWSKNGAGNDGGAGNFGRNGSTGNSNAIMLGGQGSIGLYDDKYNSSTGQGDQSPNFFTLYDPSDNFYAEAYVCK